MVTELWLLLLLILAVCAFIGGSFSLTQLDRFAAALPQLLPVHVVREGAVSEIRMAATMPAQAPAMRLPAK